MMCERQVNSGCDHLKKYKDENETSIFEDIAGNFVYPHMKQNFYELMKTMTMRCNAEKCTSICLLHTCLFCTTVLCYETHLRQHVQTTGHKFAIDNSYGNVYCFLCNNYVYDDEFLTIVDSVKQFSCSSLGFSYTPLTDIPLYKSDINLVVSTDTSEPIIRLKPTSYIGIRGLVNHGKTCFMNVVLQAFAHVPLIRNYFLSTIHKCKLKQNCFLCKIENLFTEFYSGKVEPMGLGDIVELVWKRAEHLSGDVQHDTHEFFIAALNLFHEDSIYSMKESNNSDPLNCTCVSHKIFMGQLQSNLVCKECNNISSTYDPFWDISLEICRQVETLLPPSVEECLEQYTQPEPLDINCNNCNSKGSMSKQMTFLRLPHILFLHLKRFKTIKKKTNKKSEDCFIHKKISTKIIFPHILDLTKFRSDYNSEDEGIASYELNLDDNRYELCSVINHVGPALDVGHYTTFISQHGRWFLCDDTKIKPVSLSDVLNSEAYMLVYEKKALEYS
uniref:Ubiquitin carboxyl-terminal hydrolase 22 n=1 Tax=Cacopsylla melanoneura TaxID=428564 RepID=A0A8D8YSP5_9HEMI